MMFESAILCIQACVLMLQTIVLFSALRSLSLLEAEVFKLRNEVSILAKCLDRVLLKS